MMPAPAPTLGEQPDIFARVERAYHIAVSLDISVAHLIEGLVYIHRGQLDDAHWHLWRGNWTRREPEERAA